jgi:hypothetical protein
MLEGYDRGVAYPVANFFSLTRLYRQMTEARRGDDGGSPHNWNSTSLKGYTFVMGQHGNLVAEELRRRKVVGLRRIKIRRW